MSSEARNESFTPFDLIRQGAEARVYRGSYMGKRVAIKERFIKKYRHPSLDEMLTKERMKCEARALLRCRAAGVWCPTVYLVDFERRIIVMEEIRESVPVRLFLEQVIKDGVKAFQGKCCGMKAVDGLLEDVAEHIGESIGRLHSENIVHGDLTTSNMLIPLGSQKFEFLYFIDFGLSLVSQSSEDKAVDLYVLERAILSTHPKSEWIFTKILDSYSKFFTPGSEDVLKKLDEVRTRGRKRTMIG